MRYWLDTEFLDNGFGPIHLVSLGLVAEDGREYYAVSADCPLELANDWVRAHVIPQLRPELARPRGRIRDEVAAFIAAGGPDPELWGYVVAYDWVVFCQLFGTPRDLPPGWPSYLRDLRQWADLLGSPPLPPQAESEHHALADARWNREVWEYLSRLAG